MRWVRYAAHIEESREAYTEFWWRNLRERDHLGHPGIDRRIILICGGMEWIELSQDRDSWWALVNVVMNLRVSQNAGTFFTS